MSALEFIPNILAVLRRHFPEASEPDCLLWAEKIYDEWVPGKAAEELIKNDKPVKNDIRAFALAIKHLTDARRAIEALGSHGDDAFLQVLGSEPAFLSPSDTVFRRASAPFVRDIEKLIARLEEIQRHVDGDADTLHQPRKRPETRFKLAARSVAEACAGAFRELSGRDPTVSTRTDSAKAYGPFLELVGGIFEVLGIDAKPERSARDAAAAFKGFKQP